MNHPGLLTVTELLEEGSSFGLLLTASKRARVGSSTCTSSSASSDRLCPAKPLAPLRSPKRRTNIKVTRDDNRNVHDQFAEVVRCRKEDERRLKEYRAAKIEEFHIRAKMERADLDAKQQADSIEKCKRREEQEIQLRKRREESQRKRAERMAGLKSDLDPNLPAHLAHQERYNRCVVIPELEKQREHLRKLKEMKEPPSKASLDEHERAYLLRQKEREEKRAAEIQVLRDENSKQVKHYTGRRRQFIDEERYRKQEQERELAEKKLREERKRDYGKKVSGQLPPISPLKKKPLPPKSPEKAELKPEEMKKIGNGYLQKVLAMKKKDKSEMQPKPPEPDAEQLQFKRRRDEGNRCMSEARKVIARGPDGQPLRKPTPPAVDAIQPLRMMVKKLDRNFDRALSADSGNDPNLLLKQQQDAMNAVAAVKAKLNLLQHLQTSDS
eukprot:TRINITY_DN815_c1_g2_i1.p1 TRINITY_DN815_c1_g2~~TRINITY_DN815_c1_g2_i1.p1  ORF type:complete len:441 (+),score=105.60 TRINITY_DN815_c1_g2_i1:103-1425(+)